VVGDATEARKYTLHGFRSYLASAMAAAGCTDSEIQAALRWASTDALKVYKVANAATYGGWLMRAERVRLTGERIITLRKTRHLPTTDHDDMALAVVDARGELDKAADTSDGKDDATVRALGVEGVLMAGYAGDSEDEE